MATCNALSSAQLAALHPSSGGTYVYGRRQLGPFWGHLAGFGFVVGKTESCAAMALTVGAFAMAREGELPRWLDAVHPVHRVPHHAELAVAAAVVALVLVVDLRAAIGFSSFAVLVYYAVTNASALTLRADQRRYPPAIASAGLLGPAAGGDAAAGLGARGRCRAGCRGGGLRRTVARSGRLARSPEPLLPTAG